MAKKKSQSKKHRFKYSEPTGLQGSDTTPVAAAERKAVVTAGAPRKNPVAVAAGGALVRDFSYVGVDLRRILILAVAFVALEIALWGLLEFTSVGGAVYNLIQV